MAEFIRIYLFSVDQHDFETLIGVCMLLFIIAFVACAVPAQRAWRVDPMAALRDE